MPEKVGKYRIIDRIGRGGMGMVFKAHDPVLDRFVALKVIWTEADVTDELRTRFFREAQACARLSHPNIVTIHDMGEDGGQLFFVMELLEGQELRRIIAEPKGLSLEDKLSILIQICEGLHYAHQRGIIHRDIKPGNVMLLSSGQVKILDFGIARTATTEGSLTRTGLIMGTLRYIAPEQVRGRADHCSDMYSVGAVAYELLSLRPPFIGDDPIHILEQLRTEDPPPLNEVDPDIPTDLAVIVARAMRKNPGDRFADLEEMRAELQKVQRALAEEATQVRARLHVQRSQLLQLQAALAERTGSPSDDDTVAAIDDRARLATMRALERDFSRRIEVFQARIAQADSLGPVLKRGVELLRSRRFADAAAAFEGIVSALPEHRRARELLRQAREHAETQRRSEVSAHLLEEARAAFEDGNYGLCLEIIKQAAAVAISPEADSEWGALQQRAEAALTVQEREKARQRRALAKVAGAAQRAPEVWATAEAKLEEAQAAFEGNLFESATAGFNEASALYGTADEAAREIIERERQHAEAACERAKQGREGATAVDAERDAPVLWSEALTKSGEGDAALHEERYGDAAEAFDRAAVLYRSAEAQARESRLRQREHAELRRHSMADQRHGALAADAALQAPVDWTDAEAAAADAEAAFAREAYDEAAQAFDRAASAYQRAETRAHEVVRAIQAARADAEKAREATAMASRDALEAQARKHASERWSVAESAEAQANAAMSRQDYAAARSLFVEAGGQYGAAAQEARVAAREAEAKLREMEVAARRDASPRETAKPSRAGAEPATTTDTPPAAAAGVDARAFGKTARLSPAATGAGAARSARAGVISAARRPRRRLLTEAVVVIGGLAAVGIGSFLWLSTTPPLVQRPVTQNTPLQPVASAPAQPVEPRGETPTVEGPQKPATGDRAPSGETSARTVDVGRADDAQREEWTQASQGRAAEARRAAELAGAQRLASVLWAKASSAQRRGEDAVRRKDFDRAQAHFTEAGTNYRAAEKAASDKTATEKAAAERAAAEKAAADKAADAAVERERLTAAQARREAEGAQRQLALLKSIAEEARGRALNRREQAVKTEAPLLAKDLFDAAEAKLTEGNGLVRGQDFAGANNAYRDAGEAYAVAMARAQGLAEVKTQADKAKERMLAEKRRANEGAPEFQAGLDEERQANSLYDRRAYRDAADKYRSAETLFAKAAGTPASVTPKKEPSPPTPPARPRPIPPPF